MLKIQMLEQILTKESVNEELRLSSSSQQTPVDEDGRSMSTASLRTHISSSSSSSQNSTPSTPVAVATGLVHILFIKDIGTLFHQKHILMYAGLEIETISA